MKIITYQCDLCKEIRKRPDEVYKLYWKSDTFPQRYVLITYGGQEQSDKHLCKKCYKLIKES